jgi:hypothetical protein
MSASSFSTFGDSRAPFRKRPAREPRETPCRRLRPPRLCPLPPPSVSLLAACPQSTPPTAPYVANPTRRSLLAVRASSQEAEGQFFCSHLQWRSVLKPSSAPSWASSRICTWTTHIKVETVWKIVRVTSGAYFSPTRSGKTGVFALLVDSWRCQHGRRSEFPNSFSRYFGE